MTTVNVEALRRAADLLAGDGPYSARGPIAPDRFNLATWVTEWTHAGGDDAIYPDSCPTIVCAAGACGLDPWFRSQGFQTEPQYGDGRDGDSWCVQFDAGLWGPVYGWTAIEDFFGLPWELSLWVFDDSRYAPDYAPVNVVARLRAVALLADEGQYAPDVFEREIVQRARGNDPALAAIGVTIDSLWLTAYQIDETG